MPDYGSSRSYDQEIHIPEGEGELVSFNKEYKTNNYLSTKSRFLIFTSIIAMIFFLTSYSSRITYSSWQDIISGSDEHHRAFEEFIVKHAKEYINNQEKSARFEIFKQNLRNIAEKNIEEQLVGGRAIHGVNFFTDITEGEFSEKYATLQLPDDGTVQRSSTGPVTNSHPDKLYSNWINTYTTPVNQQGGCGSCWAFSSVEQMEADTRRVVRVLGLDPVYLQLSVQELVDCVYLGISSGCRGGWISTAYQYVMSYGLERAKDDPYLARNQSFCSGEPDKYAIRLKNYTEVWGNETWMAQHVLSTGPLAVAVNALGIASYSSGVLWNCGPNAPVSHGVQIVGLNLDDAVNPYWIIRNSWGQDWGENGYFYLGYGQNLCNVSFYASYTEPLWYRPDASDFGNIPYPTLSVQIDFD